MYNKAVAISNWLFLSYISVSERVSKAEQVNAVQFSNQSLLRNATKASSSTWSVHVKNTKASLLST